MTRIFFTGLLLIGFAASGARAADEGSAMLTQRCAGCHNLTGPAPHTLKELWARKGPDLFYAGNKFRTDWLRAWLQKPTRIRPAGEFYADHIRSGEKGDEIDPTTLEPHLALSAADADAATQALMRLKAHDDLIAAEKIEPGSTSKSMGEMAFDKFLGCMACHEIEPGYGGLSGSELYTAGQRLQPEFIASYIRSPQAWDPKIWMPNKRVSDPNIQKLVHYLSELSKEQSNAK
ncbi:MAG: c-type cytochrome [Steroidobacteraceae bacterium]